ncbi:MAG TPA: efflux RND transporter periplasmic adaptor subunit [Opitutaceae bacterium]|nr:efflux RND transporter periplasmic adaptor subunit [Opitutaceae bacterium]
MKTARLVIALLTIVPWSGCSEQNPRSSDLVQSPAVRICLAAVHKGAVSMPIAVTGIVRPFRHATIAAKVMGTIEEIPVSLGQAVSAGNVLARISADEIGARVAQSQAQFSQVRRDLTRERDLFAQNASTAEMVRDLEDRLAIAQAAVREAEAMESYTTVRAPFDGVVALKLANPGDLAAPGQPLLELEGNADFQIEVSVPDSIASGLAVGRTLAVDVPASALAFTGKITEISSAADAQTHTVAAKVSVPTGLAVRSGQFARVEFPGAPSPALFAPLAAVSVIGQMERVFVDVDGRAVLRLVRTGAARGDSVEVLSGLADGDSLVLNPPAGLREGQALDSTP